MVRFVDISSYSSNKDSATADENPERFDDIANTENDKEICEGKSKIEAMEGGLTLREAAGGVMDPFLCCSVKIWLIVLSIINLFGPPFFTALFTLIGVLMQHAVCLMVALVFQIMVTVMFFIGFIICAIVYSNCGHHNPDGSSNCVARFSWMFFCLFYTITVGLMIYPTIKARRN